MTAIPSVICFADMGKQVDNPNVEQLNFRLSKPLAKQVRAYCEQHPWKPSMTRFAELAFAEYIRNHPLPEDHASSPPPKPPTRKR